MGKGKTKRTIDLSDLLPNLDDLLPPEDRDARIAEQEAAKRSHRTVRAALEDIRRELARDNAAHSPKPNQPIAFVTFWTRTTCLCGTTFESPRSLRPLTKKRIPGRHYAMRDSHQFRTQLDNGYVYEHEPWRDPHSLEHEQIWEERRIDRCYKCTANLPKFYPLVVAGPRITSFDEPRTLHVPNPAHATLLISIQHDVHPAPKRETHLGGNVGSAHSEVRELRAEFRAIELGYEIVALTNLPENIES